MTQSIVKLCEERDGIPSKLVHILGSLHEGTKGVVRAYGKVSDDSQL